MKMFAPTRRSGLAIALAAGFSHATVAPATAHDAKGEKRLERMLEGRVAGEPVNCIRTLPTAPMTTLHSTAYVFGRGHTIYVQRTRNPGQIDNRDTLVLRRFGGGQQLCRQDVATTIDPLTQIFTGAVMFEDFVPYTRVDQKEGQASK